MVIFGGLGLIVHILILMLLCHVLLSDIYSALKKISVYFVTRIFYVFYYNIDVRNLSLRTDPTFSCTVGLYVLGMFMIVTSYFFPDGSSRTFSPKKGLTNKQLKKLKGKNNPSLIHEYCAKGQVEKFKEIVKKNKKYLFARDSQGRTPLHLAAQNGHAAIVKQVISENAEYTQITDPVSGIFNQKKLPFFVEPCHDLDNHY